MGIADWLPGATGLQPGTVTRVLVTTMILVAWLLVIRVTRRILARTVEDTASRFHTSRVAGYVVGSIALVLVARLRFQGMTGLATYFGLLSAGLANGVNADQSTGRILHVPNAHIFKHAIANYDEAFGFIWNELDVTLTFESDWKNERRRARVPDHAPLRQRGRGQDRPAFDALASDAGAQ